MWDLQAGSKKNQVAAAFKVFGIPAATKTMAISKKRGILHPDCSESAPSHVSRPAGLPQEPQPLADACQLHALVVAGPCKNSDSNPVVTGEALTGVDCLEAGKTPIVPFLIFFQECVFVLHIYSLSVEIIIFMHVCIYLYIHMFVVIYFKAS